MHRWALLLFAVISSAVVAAEDLGVVGKTYEIVETDLLEKIHAELAAMEADGRMAAEQQRMKERAKAFVHRPPGALLPRATESEVYYHDPSVTTEFDVVDQNNTVIYPAGTVVNPLDYVSLTTPLVFFDGDDELQADWVRAFLGNEADNYVPMLTNGPVIELMKTWNTRLYFDQHGRYAAQLGITALPAVVRQEGSQLRVDLVAVEEL